ARRTPNTHSSCKDIYHLITAYSIHPAHLHTHDSLNVKAGNHNERHHYMHTDTSLKATDIARKHLKQRLAPSGHAPLQDGRL
ncbi:Hypothetical predicted protein, partial [Pelobates cultripes]